MTDDRGGVPRPTPLSEDYKSPDEWLADPEYAGIIITDPIGFPDGTWRMPMTWQHFELRLRQCKITRRAGPSARQLPLEEKGKPHP